MQFIVVIINSVIISTHSTCARLDVAFKQLIYCISINQEAMKERIHSRAYAVGLLVRDADDLSDLDPFRCFRKQKYETQLVRK